MHRLIIFLLLGCVFAGSQKLGDPTFPYKGFRGDGFKRPFGSGGGNGNFGSRYRGGFGGGTAANFGTPCGDGLIFNIDGSCVAPVVKRNVFVYDSPSLPIIAGPTPPIPPPKVEYNLVFVRAPESLAGVEPIIVPPPQQKTLVYVLTSNNFFNRQKIIEAPSGPLQSPEVYYINYDDDDNPILPGGISLQEGLASFDAHHGQIIGRYGKDGGFGIEGKFGKMGGIEDDYFTVAKQ